MTTTQTKSIDPHTQMNHDRIMKAAEEAMGTSGAMLEDEATRDENIMMAKRLGVWLMVRGGMSVRQVADHVGLSFYTMRWRYRQVVSPFDYEPGEHGQKLTERYDAAIQGRAVRKARKGLVADAYQELAVEPDKAVSPAGERAKSSR